MAYVHKIVGPDEQLIGIARLHWIYVIKGLAWFFVLAGGGWLLDNLVQRAALATASATGATALPAALMNLSDGVMYFLMFGGAMVFFFFTLKVLVEEIGLSSRRVMHKTGLIFIKVKQIDIEEIRGENLDLGYFGRLLGYGYLMLDCRFIGDIKLPAIEKPERFLKALHERRAKAQDSLSVVLGKGNPAPLNIDVLDQRGQQQPELPQPSTPQPEIQPPQPGPEINPPSTPQPEIAPTPVPHGPPPGQPAPQTTPQPEVPPQPQQPVPNPPPSEPPLQPPGTTTTSQTNIPSPPPPSAAEDVPLAAVVNVEPPHPASPAAPGPAAIDPQLVAQVVQQVMPQLSQQVAQEIAQQAHRQDAADPVTQDHHGLDEELLHSFDEAALDKDAHLHERKDNLEHSIH